LSPGRLGAALGYTVAIHKDGRVFSIGSGMRGGSGITLPGSAAKQITGLNNIMTVVAPNGYQGRVGAPNIAIANDGTVRGWGENIFSVIVSGGAGSVDTPIIIPTLSPAGSVSICGGATLPNLFVLRSDGTVTYTPATLGLTPTGERISTTQAVSGLSSVLAISKMCFGDLGTRNAVLVKADGTVWTLALSSTESSGPSGFITTTTYRVAIAQVTGLPAIDQVSCGGAESANGFCLALAKDGTVWAWGENGQGELGDGMLTNKMVPFQIPGLSSIRQVIAGLLSSYAIDRNGVVYSWGTSALRGFDNNRVNSMLGRTVTNNAWVPGVVTLPSPVSALASSLSHVAVLLNNGTVWSWGANDLGELGDGTTNGSSLPIQAIGLNLNN
jgi:alpha-tubulin suppressor-like RCC1 family protein